MRRRHDPFLKLLYRAGARDAITLFFPDVAARIDWAQLQWIDKEIPIESKPPRAVVADLVGRTRDVEGRYLEVLLHPELQMEPDAEMGWRVLEYNAGLLLRQASPNTRVLTFVFYHCRGAGGVKEQDHRLEFYGRTVHAVGYWSVGLGDLEAEAYAESDNPMAWALAAWMRQRREQRVELRLRLLDNILRFVRDDNYRRLLVDALRTYFRLNTVEKSDEARLLQSQGLAEVQVMLQTEFGRFEESVERRTLQNALIEFVRSRFPQAPPEVESQVRRVRSLDRLRRLIRRAATVATPEELWKSDAQ